MTRLPDWAVNDDLVEYYEHHRNRPDDLYPSEARFLPWLAERAESVLDVGCAAGGFLEIWRQFRPAIRYTGVDLSPKLIESARRLHPGADFLVGDVLAGIGLPDRSADAVQALGWLHWVTDAGRALEELWRLANRFLFFDVRITHERVTGRQRIELLGRWDGRTEVPYVTLDWEKLARQLASFEPRNLYGVGYWGPPSTSAVGVPDDVCLAAFVVERGDGAGAVALDLPLAWPDGLLPSHRRLAAAAVPRTGSATIGR